MTEKNFQVDASDSAKMLAILTLADQVVVSGTRFLTTILIGRF